MSKPRPYSRPHPFMQSLGEVVAEYTSPVNGLVGGLRTDATLEPGNVLAFILATGAEPSGQAPYSE
jgi:predicted deacylase